SSKAATLKFDKSFTNGLLDYLSVDDVSDRSDNRIVPTSLSFRYFEGGTPVPGTVIINEIMSDPAPVVGLGEAEYIELYNLNAKPFDLAGWTLSDSTSRATLPAVIVMPGEFIVLTSTSGQPKIPGSVGLPGFPSLSNAGEPLVLRSAEDKTIDSVRYSSR